MKKYSLSALAAAGLLVGGLSATSASAADLGGNCCADLEERIAELEATTVRKGNRKVSLTISGWVAEQVTFWDDGVESNAYVGGIGTTLGTNVKFTGQASIAPGWTAGYVLHLEADGSDTLAGTNRAALRRALASTRATPTTCRRCSRTGSSRASTSGRSASAFSRWFRTTSPSSLTVPGSLVPANWVTFDVGGFAYRRTDGGISNTTIIGAAAATAAATATAFPPTPSVTTLPRSPASRSRLLGVRTTFGMSAAVTPASSRASRLPRAVSYGEITSWQQVPAGLPTGLSCWRWPSSVRT